jgi:hypothetical protein
MFVFMGMLERRHRNDPALFASADKAVREVPADETNLSKMPEAAGLHCQRGAGLAASLRHDTPQPSRRAKPMPAIFTHNS